MRRAVWRLSAALALCLVVSPALARPTDTEATISRHNHAYLAGDREAMLADYASDVVFVGHGQVIRGLDALRKAVAEAKTPQQGEFRIDRLSVDGDVAVETWTRGLDRNHAVHGKDVFVVRNGKIAVQIVEEPGSGS